VARHLAAISTFDCHNKEKIMPTIIGHHNLTKGAKHWLTSPKRKELFGPLGVTNIRTFVDPQNPTRVAVLMDVPDMDALMAVPCAVNCLIHTTADVDNADARPRAVA
jgi:hypothetical protein